VVDEAFIEFTSIDSLIPLTKKYNNLLILKSMTKYYSIPGLRLGYMVGSALLIERLKRFKQPWSVNAMALNAGHFIFDNIHKLAIQVQSILHEREVFTNSLKELKFIRVYPSSTHFFLCETLIGTSKELKAFLIAKYGILIRDASNFRGLGKGHFRLATLDSKQNQLLVKGIAEWIRNY
jgi:threonine-phosphate decarboxylase